MLKNFIKVIDEAVDAGCQRGNYIFIESLEEDLSRSEILAENGFKNVLTSIYDNSGYDVLGESDNLEDIDENKLDQLLEKLEQEIGDDID